MTSQVERQEFRSLNTAVSRSSEAICSTMATAPAPGALEAKMASLETQLANVKAQAEADAVNAEHLSQAMEQRYATLAAEHVKVRACGTRNGHRARSAVVSTISRPFIARSSASRSETIPPSRRETSTRVTYRRAIAPRQESRSAHRCCFKSDARAPCGPSLAGCRRARRPESLARG